MSAEEYFNLRQSTRAYQNPYESGGIGVGGLTASARYNRQQVGSSFLSAPSGISTWNKGTSTGGGTGGYVQMPSTGPTPVTRDIERGQATGPAKPEAYVTGAAGNFGSQRIDPFDPQWSATKAVSAGVGAAVGAGIRQYGKSERAQRKSKERAQTSAVSDRAAGAATVAGARRAMGREDKTDKDDGGNTVADQPWGPPDPAQGKENPYGRFDPTQRRGNPWAAPDPKDNRTYTTGDSPMTMADSADPFIGPDTDELGRPLRDISNKGVAPWGPPTGAPRHGPIFLADAASDTPKSSDGGTATAPTQSWAPPSAADYVEPATPNEASIARDAEDPMDFFVDNSGNELPRPEPAGGQETARSTSSGRPESTGRTVPGRPGGPRLAANPNSWFSGGASEFAGAQPAATAPQSRREQVYASRPQSLGREVVGSPFRPNSVMAQRRAAAEQARVEQVSTAYEYPTAAGPPQQMSLFDQDAPSSEGSLLFSPEEQAQMDADNASFAAGTAALEAETAATRRRNQQASRGGNSRSRSRSRRQIQGQQQFDI